MWLLWRGIIGAVCGSWLPTFLHEPFYHKQILVLTHSFQQNQPTTVSQTWMSLAFNKLLAHQTVLITTGKQYKYHILYYTCKILSSLSMPKKLFIVYGVQGDNSGFRIINKQINTCVSIMFFGWCHLHLSPVCVVQLLCSNRVLTSAALWHMYWLNMNPILRLSIFYISIAFPSLSKDINRFLNQMTLSP